jgi:hypothetical protein
MKRLIVAGSRGLRLRHVNNVRDAIRMFVDMYWRPTHIVCGGCHDENSGEDAIGADMLGAHRTRAVRRMSCGGLRRRGYRWWRCCLKTNGRPRSRCGRWEVGGEV